MRNIIKDSKIHYIWIKTNTDNYYKVILKLKSLNIDIYEIKYGTKNILLKIKNSDYSKINKYLKSYKFLKVNDTGYFNIINILKQKRKFISSLIFGILLIYFFINVIVKVNVIHSKKDIRVLVTNALEEKGIKRLTLKKDYQTLQKIKQEILEENKDKLEWIEIETDGMTYNVRIEERIITNIEEEKNTCHIVADKSGIVTKIMTYRGVSNVNVNSYVEKGDILISGEVKLNEETKDNVCASGNVYAEVWYTVKVTLPLNYEEAKRTGKMRYNFMYEDKYNKHVILKSRLKNKEVENKEIISLLGKKIYLQKEYETTVKKKKYNEQEALKKALLLAKEKLSVKLDENESIITQKVLKKSTNDSKMELEVFTSVEENIGRLEEYTPELAKEQENDLDNT